MHGGHNPGYPASHGCIRLPAAFAKRLYGVTEVGTPVYIGA
jgi:lipoprotein-anchoring transpeptidase ErfK/SrfK